MAIFTKSRTKHLTTKHFFINIIQANFQTHRERENAGRDYKSTSAFFNKQRRNAWNQIYLYSFFLAWQLSTCRKSKSLNIYLKMKRYKQRCLKHEVDGIQNIISEYNWELKIYLSFESRSRSFFFCMCAVVVSWDLVRDIKCLPFHLFN